MCKLGGGANRCEAHWGPTQKAADLARRRAKYATKKGGEVKYYRPRNGEPVNPLPVVAPDFHQAWESPNPVDWSQLDEESYKAFGFSKPGEMRTSMQSIDEGELESQIEMSILTEEERLGVKFFTSSNYDWINGELYNSIKDYDKPTQSEEERNARAEEVFSNIAKESQETRIQMLDVEDHSPKLLNKMLTLLDSALEDKGEEKETRTLYRGTSLDVLYGDFGKGRQAIRDMKLGQEMVFDGYQSSSMNPDTALMYSSANTDGDYGEPSVLFEIRTKTGINVMSESEYIDEYEVLLPRNARYMVVGKHSEGNYMTEDIDSQDSHYTRVTVIQLVAVDEEGKAI